MRILITGGTGYLGGSLANYEDLIKNNEIIITSRLAVVKEKKHPNISYTQVDWDDNLSLKNICSNVDLIIHAAGMNSADCLKNSRDALYFNGCVTAALIQNAIKSGVQKFIYLSTAHVYNSPLVGKIDENTCPRNLHPYATSHRAGEDVVLAANKQNEINGVVLRLSNVYGKPVNSATDCWKLVINDLCRQAATSKKMTLMTSGMSQRDFITLTDFCRAITHIASVEKTSEQSSIYNIGSSKSLTLLQIAQKIAERCNILFGYTPKIFTSPIRIGEVIEELLYSNEKFLNTGFILKNNQDDEIDKLLIFCSEEKNINK